jgi:hypothetical protein
MDCRSELQPWAVAKTSAQPLLVAGPRPRVWLQVLAP